MSTWIHNARLVSPGMELENAAVEMADGLIRRVAAPGERPPPGTGGFDAQGAMVLPGFIDLHFHGAGGADFCDGTPEAVETIARAKLREGVTTCCPATLTLPEERLAAALRAAAAFSGKRRPGAARLAGVHLEGPFISSRQTGAQNPAYVRAPDIEEVRRLASIAPVALLTFAVEADGALALAEGLVKEGIAPACGHSAADLACFNRARARGVRRLTHFGNQMSPLHHREIGLVGAGLLYDDVTVELIADRVHLCPEMIDLVFKVKPIDRIELVTDSIAASWLDDGEYELGGLPVRVASGEARLASNGALAGSVLRMYDALRNVQEITGRPLAELVQTVSLNQARSLGLEKTGRIAEGWKADLVVLADDFSPRAVFMDGRREWQEGRWDPN